MTDYGKLILTMMAAYDDYETELGFTKQDIDNFIKKYNFFEIGERKFMYAETNNFVEDWNERASLMLWSHKYLTNEQLAKELDLTFEDGKFWLVVDDFKSILRDKYETEISMLDGDLEWQGGEYYDNDIESYFWHRYTDETLKEIIEYCDKQGFEIDDDSEEETILLSKENMKIVKHDIYINKTIKLIDKLDDLDELKDILNGAICEAQEDADRGEQFNDVKNAFVNKVGPYKHKSVDVNGKSVDKLWIDMSDVDFSEVESNLKESYGEFEFDQADYGSLYYILRDEDYFDFRKPDYSYISGNIDYAYLNELTQNRLTW